MNVTLRGCGKAACTRVLGFTTIFSHTGGIKVVTFFLFFFLVCFVGEKINFLWTRSISSISSIAVGDQITDLCSTSGITEVFRHAQVSLCHVTQNCDVLLVRGYELY